MNRLGRLVSITVRAFTYSSIVSYNGLMKILYTSEQVQARIEQMAKDVIDRFHDNKPLFVCLLKGAVPFTAQLMSAITRQDSGFHPEVVYMHASAYGTDQTPGDVSVYSSVDTSVITNRSIIVLDDCLDKGITFTTMKQLLLDSGAASVGLIVLIDKDVIRDSIDAPLLVGFTTPDVWLVGMGLDDAATAPEAERWAGYIGDVSQQ